MDGPLVFVLVASTDERLRAALGDLLRSAGYAVLKATTPDEVLRQAGAPVRLILLHGPLAAVARHLKADPLLAPVPVLAMAGEAADADLVVPADTHGPALLLHARELLARFPTAATRPMLALLRELIDGLTAHVAILDLSGVILAVNEAWRSFARRNDGDPRQLCEGVNYLDLCAGSCGDDTDAGVFVEQLRQVTGGRRREFAHEYPCHSPHELRWFVARVRRVAIGGTEYVLVAHENVTDHRRVAEALAKTNHRLIDVLDGLTDAFLLLDSAGVVTYANAGVRHLLGVPAADLVGREFRMEPGERFIRQSSCWVECHASPAGGGQLVHLRDITDRRKEREAGSEAKSEQVRHLEVEVDHLRRQIARPEAAAGRRDPALFADWVKAYEEVLDLALDQRAYRVDHHTSDRLKRLAARLGYAGAMPRDVIEVHAEAMRPRTRDAHSGRAYRYLEEGRIVVLELMGHLASYYRAGADQRQSS